MPEVWRDVLGHEETHEVSSLGMVRTKHSGRILALWVRRCGYRTVTLCVPGRLKLCRDVHRLVTEAFLGPRPDGLFVNHINGIKTDNRLENLEYVTPRENIMHAIRTGLMKHSFGESHRSAKLTVAKVLEIRSLLPTTLRSVLAKQFGVSYHAIRKIEKRLSWAHVS